MTGVFFSLGFVWVDGGTSDHSIVVKLNVSIGGSPCRFVDNSSTHELLIKPSCQLTLRRLNQNGTGIHASLLELYTGGGIGYHFPLFWAESTLSYLRMYHQVDVAVKVLPGTGGKGN